jgi:hypothetical protein
MTSQQEERLSMYLTFKDFQAPRTSITDGLPNYLENSTIFLNTIPQIQSIWEQQKLSKKGVTDSKNQLKESLIVHTADYARKLGTYAKFTNNAKLAQEVKFSEGKLRQVADTAVKSYGQIVYDLAQPLVGSLAQYGITEETQATLAGAITAYNDSIGKPGAERIEGSQLTKQLASLFKTADTALENMDAAVEIVRLTEVDFYNGYKSARRVIETGAGSLSVKGLVTDAQTGSPLKGVTVSFALDGGTAKAGATTTSEPALVKKTAEKGGFNIKGLATGTYQVTLKKAGYADQVVTVNVNDGEMTELKISLEKNIN